MMDIRRSLAKWVVLGLFSGSLVFSQVAWSGETSGVTTTAKSKSKNLPDLVVTQIKTPQNLKAGERVSIELTVANIGEDNFSPGASSVTVNLHLGRADIICEVSLPEAGDEVIQEIKFIFPLSRWYDIVATVDPQNDIEESNEENNQATKKVWVSGTKSSGIPRTKKSGCPCGK